MIYLDERIKVTIEDFSWAGEHEAGMYQYFVFDNAAPTANLFVGNLYLEKNQYSVTVDITDIARNYCASTNKMVLLEVGIRFSAGDPSGVSDYIVPIYRYPNAKADDNKYNFDGYDTFLVSGKQSVKNFNYSSSLLPTYPQRTTDKITIDYLVGLKRGTGTDSFTFDYGPTQTISNTLTNIPTLYSLSYPLAEGTKTVTDVNPLYDFDSAWSTDDDNPIISFIYKNNKNYINYNYSSALVPSEIDWSFAGGTNNTTAPSEYPFSLTISDSDYNDSENAYACDLYIYDADLNTIIETYPYIDEGNYTCEVTCDIAETLEIHDCSSIDWISWQYTNNYFVNGDYSNMTVGSTIVKVKFTDSSEAAILDISKTLTAEGITFEWDQTLTSDVQQAIIRFETGTDSYFSEMPLDLINSDSLSDARNLIFTVSADDEGSPILYVNHSVYEYNISYNATLSESIEAPLADDIVAYRGDKYSFVQTDDNYTLEVEGDLEIENSFVTNKYLCKNFALNFYQNGVATRSRYSQATTVALMMSNTPIDDSYFLVQYYDTSNNLREGKVWVKPTNPQSNSYYYASFYIQPLSDGTFRGGVGSSVYKKFGHYTYNGTKIGQFGCPSGYYLIWKDRLGSQQIQPFQKVDTYSEDITGSEITNYWGKRSLYTVEVQPKWKVQTGWISDEAYRCYESLFVSPTLQLYDADSDILYDVILKSRAYTEKTYLNQGKMFNLQIELEQTEKQGILF